MIKLSLIGDPELQHYTVTDRLWELISVVIDKKLKFSIIPVANQEEVMAAFEIFQKDRSYVGLNIADPWKETLAEQVNRLEQLTDLPIINTIYRDGKSLVGVNTEPLAMQRALESQINLYKCKSALVLGANGAGLSIASHLHRNLDKKTYLYDLSAIRPKVRKGIIHLSHLADIPKRQYDLIINATPLGGYYFNKRIEAFTSPLDLETLKKISHEKTIVQETNYLPSTTLLLQMARHLELPVVTGDLMLVFNAVERLKRYFGITLDENTIHMLVTEISASITERETIILG